MAEIKEQLKQIYSAFNERNIDGALAPMTADVSWPRASEGGSVVGKEEIRAYWTRQWGEFDPHVEPMDVFQADTGTLHVRVHQVVKDLHGKVLFDGEVWHIHTVVDGLITKMELGESGEGAKNPSSAFARQA